MIGVGQEFPYFVKNGVDYVNAMCEVAYDDFNGWKVYYFYPKDFTPGCTAEVCGFRDNYEQLKELNCEVIGISADSISRHHSFTQKYNLNYHLLSDSNKKIRKIFKVPTHLFGIIPGRVTYVIDLEGKIRGINNALADAHYHIKFALNSLKN